MERVKAFKEDVPSGMPFEELPRSAQDIRRTLFFFIFLVSLEWNHVLSVHCALLTRCLASCSRLFVLDGSKCFSTLQCTNDLAMIVVEDLQTFFPALSSGFCVSVVNGE
jgi:hypothetical protein